MSQVHHTLNLYGPSESEPLKYSSLRVVANDIALTFIISLSARYVTIRLTLNNMASTQASYNNVWQCTLVIT